MSQGQSVCEIPFKAVSLFLDAQTGRQHTITSLADLNIYKNKSIDVNYHLTKEADYLDTTDSFMGLGHADGLRGILIRQHLSAAKVVRSKDDPINEIFWLTGTWDFAA